MPRTSLVTLVIVLLLTALPFTAAAKQQPWEPAPDLAPAALAAPSSPIPPDGTRLSSMGAVTLQWNLPAGSTQYQLQVTPFNGDGPGINLIRNAEGQFTIPSPPTWYVLLPGMTYTWRVRVTDFAGSVSEGDSSWGPWSPSWRFATPQPTAETISPTQPALGTTATSQNPTLVWTDANPGIFYYEIQLSSDPLFNTDPFTATAAVYWNLVHGGETAPQNSWAVPLSARLDADGKRYYWRVRPRVQGNGTPVNWGLPFWFQTIGGDSLPNPDLSVTTLETGAASVAPGGSVQIQYTIKNLGVGASVTAEVHAVLSPDVNITRLKQDLGPINTVGALGSQQSVSQLATVQIPANQPVGSYFLGVYVDWTNQNRETESGKSGNNGLGKLLTVTQVVVAPTITVTPTSTNTPSPMATNTPTPTFTPNPTATNTATPMPTLTPTPALPQPLGCVMPPSGILSWWPGEGNANDMKNRNPGVLRNGAGFAAGRVGQAFSFDGVDDYVDASTDGMPTSNVDRSIETWVRIDSRVAEESFFAGYGAFGSANRSYHLGANSGEVFWSTWGQTLAGPSLSTGQWNHLAITTSGPSASLYLNGNLVKQGQYGIDTPSGSRFYMGRIAGANGEIRRLSGLVDEVTVYNRALLGTEVLAINNAGSAGKCKVIP
ncbi:MAG: hypothetical protein NTZ05_18190 [Chloroflexi bacterium]|nr:hypothetical protein [Chloroflexota bacterium]